MATWTIEPNQNNGYPINLNFLVGSISSRWQEGNYNLTNWRIKPDFDVSALNTGVLAPIVESPNAYPHIWAATQIIGSGGGGEEGDGDIMHPGGHTRPTRHYTTVPQGHMSTAHHDHKRTTRSALSAKAAQMVNGYITNAGGVNALRTSLNSFPVNHQGDMIAISQIYGANIFNAVVLARVFPFALAQDTDTGQQGVNSMNVLLADSTKFYYLTYSTVILDFGTVDLDVTQGFEITKYTYKLYLPYSGVHSIDIRGDEEVQLIGYVDLFAGTIDYIFYVNDQIELTAQGKIGIDIPLNVQQGEMLQNAIMNAIKYTAQPIATIAGAGIGKMAGSSIDAVKMGAEIGGKAGAWVGGQAAEMTVPLSSSNVSGGASAADMYSQPCIIVKKQVMHIEGYGYPEELGFRHLAGVNDLSRQKELIVVSNYKCGVDGATEREKQEIIRLLEGGVFV